MAPSRALAIMKEMLDDEPFGSSNHIAIEQAIAAMEERKSTTKSPGRPCWWKHWSNPETQPWLRGFFLGFCQEGDGPMAIIEHAVDHAVDTYPLKCINFSEEKPA
jgi:hypothetical protein